jgi:hypothetical protein
MPRSPSSQASPRPTGPAPAMTTDVSAFTLIAPRIHAVATVAEWVVARIRAFTPVFDGL